MKLVRSGKISYLQPRQLSGTIVAGFTTRNGGISRPPYNSLNLGMGTEDSPANIEGNRSNLTRSFGLEPRQLLTVKQVHGLDILLIDTPNLDLSHFTSVEADAIVTDQRGIMIGILTADCYPILLWHQQKPVAAVIHAGWRGAAGGLIGKTVDTLAQNFACPATELRAAIGPGIGAHKYEVDRPVRDAFRQGSGNWESIAKETRLGHWQLDIGLSCRLQLEACGLAPQQIEVAEPCTCCNPELFFSHRRDNGKTGRQIGFMKLS